MKVEKKNLLIKDYEDKKGKTSGKRYTRFETNEGWFSAFEKDVIEPIKALEGKWALCGVVVTEKNKNIREFHGPGKQSSESEDVEVTNTDGSVGSVPMEKKGGLLSQKDCSIVAQCLTKATVEYMKTKPEAGNSDWLVAKKQVMKCYKDFNSELENKND